MHRPFLRWAFTAMLILPMGVLQSTTPPELATLLQTFLNQRNTTIAILQETDWRFYPKIDSLHIQMDIQDDRHFQVTVPAYGLEVYVLGDSLLTVNHGRQQILLEAAGPRELIDQIFIGGDLDDARLKRRKTEKDGRERLIFNFRDEYSEWESLEILTQAELPQEIILKDYDGNRYIIHLTDREVLTSVDFSRIRSNAWGYPLADLRK